MKVLIVDDEQEIASLFQDYLEVDGRHEVSVAYSGAEALQKIKESKPDLIILDILMPGLTGFQLLGAIKRNEEMSEIPIILSSVTDGPSPKENKHLGIVNFIRKPIDFSKLNQTIEELNAKVPKKQTIPSVSQDKISVLVIEDDPDDAELLIEGLKNMGCSVITALDGHRGIRLAQETVPDLIVLDYLLPAKNGLDVIKELKSSEKTCQIPVILVSAYTPSNIKGKVYMLRDDPANTTPLSVDDLCKKIKEIFPR